MLSGPTLETERLILRLPQASDFDRYAEFFASEESRHIGGPLLRGDAWRRFLQMPGAWLIQGYAMFSVIEKASGKWVGRIGPWYPFAWPGTEVGWGLHPDARGKGYAVEAAAASIDYAFDVLQWTTVIHLVHPDNVRSRRVAERLGATLQGQTQMPAPYADEIAEVWGQSGDAWRANRLSTRRGPGPPRRVP